MDSFELIHCPACGHSQKPRPARHQWIIACLYCGNQDMEVYDLLPVARSPQAIFAPAYGAKRQHRGADRDPAHG